MTSLKNHLAVPFLRKSGTLRDDRWRVVDAREGSLPGLVKRESTLARGKVNVTICYQSQDITILIMELDIRGSLFVRGSQRTFI